MENPIKKKPEERSSFATILLGGGILAGLYYAFKKGMLNFGATQTPATEEQPQVEALAQFIGDAADLQDAVELAGGTVSSVQGNVAIISIPANQINTVSNAANVVSVQPTGNVIQQTTQPVTGTAVTPTEEAIPPINVAQVPQKTIDAYNLLCSLLNTNCYKDKNGDVHAIDEHSFNTAFSNYIETYGYLFPPTLISLDNAIALKKWIDAQIMEKAGIATAIPYDKYVYKDITTNYGLPLFIPLEGFYGFIKEITGQDPVVTNFTKVVLTPDQYSKVLAAWGTKGNIVIKDA